MKANKGYIMAVPISVSNSQGPLFKDSKKFGQT